MATLIEWLYKAMATWYGAAIIGGFGLIFARDANKSSQDSTIR
jgi:hypothetical protein